MESAINEKTLQLKGTGLKKLKAESITLAGNEVVSVTPAADGKSAVVTFKFNFPLDQEQTVKIEQEGTKEFKFTYSLAEIKTVELDVKSYDDDTKGQILTFKVNGESTTADADFLRQAGYTVNFVAVDKDGEKAPIFYTGKNTSATGLLKDEVEIGDYTVEVQLIKDGKVVLSDKQVITVSDIESTTTAISTVELTNLGANKVVAGNDDFVQKSTTLVAGEKAQISKLTGNAAGKTGVELPVKSAEITSSNPSVVSVSGETLTANSEGTATITVKMGNVSKTVTVTVTNKERALTKVTPSEAKVKVVKATGVTRTIQVTAADQYGDPIKVLTGDNKKGAVNEDFPKNVAGVDLVKSAELSTTATGKGTFEITGNAVGDGEILFKDVNGNTVGQVAVQVTDEDNVHSRKVEFAATSAVTSNTFAKDTVATYQYSQFNKDGFFNDVAAVSTVAEEGYYGVASLNEKVATVNVAGDNKSFEVIPGEKAGSTDITITNKEGQIVEKFTVTITESPVVITKVNFKATSTIDYANKLVDINDVLDVRIDGNGHRDSIVYGVEHNADTIAKVRLDNTKAEQPLLYIDTNAPDKGKYEAGKDILLGAVTAEVLSDATGGMTAGEINIAPGAYSTASKHKGSILFRVLVESNGTEGYQVSETVATTTLNVK